LARFLLQLGTGEMNGIGMITNLNINTNVLLTNSALAQGVHSIASSTNVINHHHHNQNHHSYYHQHVINNNIIPPREKHTVHWFRKGLRIHDNPSLRDGIRHSSTFRCIFIIDPWFAGSSNVGINKWRLVLGFLWYIFRCGIFYGWGPRMVKLWESNHYWGFLRNQYLPIRRFMKKCTGQIKLIFRLWYLTLFRYASYSLGKWKLSSSESGLNVQINFTL